MKLQYVTANCPVGFNDISFSTTGPVWNRFIDGGERLKRIISWSHVEVYDNNDNTTKSSNLPTHDSISQNCPWMNVWKLKPMVLKYSFTFPSDSLFKVPGTQTQKADHSSIMCMDAGPRKMACCWRILVSLSSERWRSIAKLESRTFCFLSRVPLTRKPRTPIQADRKMSVPCTMSPTSEAFAEDIDI